MASAPMDMRPYRRLLRAAAAYNLLFFAWTAVLPGQFFDWIGLPDAKAFHFLWQCVGLLVGCYGVGYYWAARDPAQGRIVIAVGFLGRVLSPLAWAVTFARGGLPARTFLIVLVTDILWWPAFLALTLDGGGRLRWWDRCVVSIVVAGSAACGGLLASGSTGSTRATLGWMALSIAATFSPPLVSLLFRRYPDAFPGARTRWVLRAAIVSAAAGCVVVSAWRIVRGHG